MSAVKVEYPGLLREVLPSGAVRYRVRVAGKRKKRIRIFVTPGHKDFGEHYHAARAGVQLPPPVEIEDVTTRGSVAWLVLKYLAHLEREVDARQKSPKTLKDRRPHLMRLSNELGEHPVSGMPAAAIIKLRDDMIETPAAADSFVKAVRAMFVWAIDRGHADRNPAIGLKRIDAGKGGATPWTVEDLRQFAARHPAGTTPHLCLTLLLFTGCRIGDAAILGRQHETTKDGMRALAWQPRKKGSAPVSLPMLDPLYDATRAAKVQGRTYLLNAWGQPFATPDSLGGMFRKWCRQAALSDRSAHGVRKGLASLLVELGATEYQAMAILAHTEPKTSAIYTRGAERWRLSREGMSLLKGFTL